MFYRDNWLAWSYDNGPDYGPKLTPMAKCTFIIRNTITQPVKSYYEELLANAQRIRDTFTGDLDLLFSGGVDSEVVLRTYHTLGIPINVYIFKYENDYNVIEFRQAIKICNELGVTPRIIDFNLEKFFENDAYDIWKKVYCAKSGWLPHMKMTEYLDGTPIIGSGDPYWKKTDNGWMFELDEGAKHWSVYHKTINRDCVADWYEYSPEMIVSHTQLPLIQDLINDRIPGKLSSFSSKPVVHKAYWPTVDIRYKMVGFEGPTPSREKPVPDFMVDFSTQYGKGNVHTSVQLFSEKELMNVLQR